MAVQNLIGKNIAFGIVGEVADTTPSVIDTYTVASGTTTPTVGYAFTLPSQGNALAGGINPFIGIAVNPKAYANYNADLSANVILRVGTTVELLTKGRFVANVGGAGIIGAGVYFINATGALGAGTAVAGQTQIVGAKIVKYDAGANGLALVQIW
jgi:hypothetical protein